MQNSLFIAEKNKKLEIPKVILPFRYAGGKYYALKKLRPFWENFFHDEYREPFLGGGSVFWAKQKVKYNWINDIDNDLIACLNVFRETEKRDILLEFFENEQEASKEKHTIVKQLVTKNEIEQVYKYYYLNRTSFSGKMKNPSWGYKPKRSLPPCRFKERIIPCGQKLEDVKITNLDFEEVIKTKAQGSKVLMFLDPPYFKAKQESHYVFPFKKQDHIRLMEILKTTPFNFFLTYDDCTEIRELYAWANIYELSFVYRLDNSKDNQDRRKMGNELVITNYTPTF